MRYNIIRGKGYAGDWNPFLCQSLTVEIAEDGVIVCATADDRSVYRTISDGTVTIPLGNLVGTVTLSAYRGNEYIPLGTIKVESVGDGYLVIPMVDVVGKVCTADAEVALLRKEVDALRVECAFLTAQIKKMMEGYDIT